MALLLFPDQQVQVVDLATHGVFLPGSTPALVRSALALAPSPAERGARQEDDRDGLVTALEVAGMDLWGTQLVVLSACDSGIGDVQRGEGVVGLRRSFFVAGTETLVTSLWKIADNETQVLMADYYQRLKAGEGRAAALDRAALAMKDSQPPPYYWASFIVLGRGEPLSRELTAAP